MEEYIGIHHRAQQRSPVNRKRRGDRVLNKEMVQFFQATVMDQFDDRRAKMRSQAYVSTLDLVRVSLIAKDD